MIDISWRKLVTALCFGVAAYLVSTTAFAANRFAGASQSQSTAPASADRSQWRKLRRHMSRDEVRKLLGEPDRISVSRFYESWEYLGGSVTFDGKGHVDFWSEP